MTFRSVSALAVLALTSALAAGCAGGSGSTQAAGPGAVPGEGKVACVPVGKGLMDQIAVSKERGVPFRPTEGAAVQAREGVYVVALAFAGLDGKKVTGVWTVTSLTGSAAPILVADENASLHSGWSAVYEFPQYGVPLDSPLIPAARSCLG